MIFTEKRRYFGYVVGTTEIPLDPDKPDGPQETVWKIRVQDPGEYQGKRVTVDRASVPEGIAKGLDVRFDLVTYGRRTKVLATNVELFAQTQQKDNRTHGHQEHNR